MREQSSDTTRTHAKGGQVQKKVVHTADGTAGDTAARAVGYSRVSTSQQAEDGFSLEEQERLLRERGCAHVYVDTISGARSDRPEYQAMLAAAAAGEFDVLYVWKIDRLGRDAEELLRARRMLEAAGVRIYSLTEGEAESTLVYGVRALVAQEEREKIGQRVRMGRAAANRKGRRGGGPRCFGFVQDGGLLAPHAIEAPWVRFIFESCKSGIPQSHIAATLNENKIPTVTGKPWTQGRISQMLRLSLYVGELPHGGEHDQPLIDRSLWDEVQALLAARAKTKGGGKGRPTAGSHLLTSAIFHCGRCGGVMRPRTTRNRQGRIYERYACDTRLSRRECDQPALDRGQVDSAVLAYFMDVGVDIAATREHFEQREQRERDATEAMLALAQQEHAHAEERLARVKRDYTDGDITAAEWRELKGDLAAEREAAGIEVERLTARLAEICSQVAVDDAEQQTLQYLAELRKAVAGDVRTAEGITAARAALTRLFEKFVLTDDGMLEPVLRPEAVLRTAYVPLEGDREGESLSLDEALAQDGLCEVRQDVARVGLAPGHEKQPVIVPTRHLFGPIAVRP
jgi:site-specific DNA recombinase